MVVEIVALCVLGTLALAPTAKPEPALAEVVRIKDLAYYDKADADPRKHKLDLYTPKDVKDFPVVIFVHGGSWRSGDRKLYESLGVHFAERGIGTAIISYRLTPQVQHPAHVEDVARAFAWVHGNIAQYGGRPDRVFMVGHSAGGHLASLLATDPQWLKPHKLSPADIRGVVSVSGVYTIVPLAVMRSAFSDNEEVCKAASPLNHVDDKAPPFLVAYAQNDIPFLDKMASDFHAKLKEVKVASELKVIKDTNHITVIIRMAGDRDDGLFKACVDFIRKNSGS